MRQSERSVGKQMQYSVNFTRHLPDLAQCLSNFWCSATLQAVEQIGRKRHVGASAMTTAGRILASRLKIVPPPQVNYKVRPKQKRKASLPAPLVEAFLLLKSGLTCVKQLQPGVGIVSWRDSSTLAAVRAVKLVNAARISHATSPG